MHALVESRFAHEQRHAVGLASLYALGHATVVTILGVSALILGAVLPAWVVPILQKAVGLTRLLLGAGVILWGLDADGYLDGVRHALGGEKAGRQRARRPPAAARASRRGGRR